WRELGISASLGAPILVDGGVWGVVAVVRNASREPFAPAAEHRLGDLAGLVAPAGADAEAPRAMAAVVQGRPTARGRPVPQGGAAAARAEPPRRRAAAARRRLDLAAGRPRSSRRRPRAGARAARGGGRGADARAAGAARPGARPASRDPERARSQTGARGARA